MASLSFLAYPMCGLIRAYSIYSNSMMVSFAIIIPYMPCELMPTYSICLNSLMDSLIQPFLA